MSLPAYSSLPSYTAEPGSSERRIELSQPSRSRHGCYFIKQSRNGAVSLRLYQQASRINTPPIYSREEVIRGFVELSKTDNVTSVEVKIEGTLQLQEIAESGKSSSKLCSNRLLLWTKGEQPCPPSLPFSSKLPATFSDNHRTYPLPPTYECHLSGFPGFRAYIEYSVSVIINKGKANLFGLGNSSISTRFTYLPRTRPAAPLPPMLSPTAVAPGIIPTPEWRCFMSAIRSRKSGRGDGDVETRLFIPASKIFSLTQPIPFYLSFMACSAALTAFLPLAPASNKQHTQIRLLRQSIVDSAAQFKQTEIWSLVSIGEGNFKFIGGGPMWSTFAGEISVFGNIKNPGFKAAGLHIRDSISLTMIPPPNGPYKELQMTAPIQLTTDPWSASSEAPPYPIMDERFLENVLHPRPDLCSDG